MTDEYGGETQAPPPYGTEEQPTGYPPAAPPPAQEPQPTTVGGGEEPVDVVAAPEAGGEGSKEEGDGGYFAPRMRRLITTSMIITWFALLAFAYWFDTDDISTKSKQGKDLKAVFDMHAAGLFFIFLGVIAVIVVQLLEWRSILEERMWFIDLGVSGVVGFGAVLYCIAGMMYAGYVNKYLDDLIDEHESLAGIYFFESTLVAAVAAIVAVDNFFNWLSLSQRIRIYFVYSPLFIFVSLLLFFCYSIVAGDEFYEDYENELNCIAVGWFFVLLATSCYVATEFAEICCGWNDGAKEGCATYQDLMLNIFNGVNVFGGFLVFCGMWALADSVNSDSRGDKEDENNFAAYYVGYGFFVWFMTLFMAFDISWGEFVESRFG